MTRSWIPPRVAAVVLLLAIAGSALSGCAPSVTSPVGVWEAVGDDRGALTIHSDGAFDAESMSFNLLERADAGDDFTGAGSWRLSADGNEVILSFDRASDGDFTVNTDVAVRVDFTSGAMQFSHVEGTASIELQRADAPARRRGDQL